MLASTLRPEDQDASKVSEYWELPYIQTLQVSISSLKDTVNLRDGGWIRLTSAMASPVLPLIVLLLCLVPELVKPGSGIAAGLQAPTQSFMDAMSEEARRVGEAASSVEQALASEPDQPATMVREPVEDTTSMTDVDHPDELELMAETVEAAASDKKAKAVVSQLLGATLSVCWIQWKNFTKECLQERREAELRQQLQEELKQQKRQIAMNMVSFERNSVLSVCLVAWRQAAQALAKQKMQEDFNQFRSKADKQMLATIDRMAMQLLGREKGQLLGAMLALWRSATKEEKMAREQAERERLNKVELARVDGLRREAAKDKAFRTAARFFEGMVLEIFLHFRKCVEVSVKERKVEEVEQLKDKLTEVEAQYASANAAAEHERHENEALREQALQVQQLKDKLAEMQAQCSSSDATVEQQRQEIQRLQTEVVQGLKDELAKQKEQIESLKAAAAQGVTCNAAQDAAATASDGGAEVGVEAGSSAAESPKQASDVHVESGASDGGAEVGVEAGSSAAESPKQDEQAKSAEEILRQLAPEWLAVPGSTNKLSSEKIVTSSDLAMLLRDDLRDLGFSMVEAAKVLTWAQAQKTDVVELALRIQEQRGSIDNNLQILEAGLGHQHSRLVACGKKAAALAQAVSNFGRPSE